jgi:anti-sigma regulatory factor (Ser/Thr protein kinase)
MEPREIRLQIESLLDNVPLLGAAVNKLCRLLPFSDRDAHAIELCVTEAAVNSIKHGYDFRTGHTVDVLFRQEPDRVEITVSDCGAPMRPQILIEKKHCAIPCDPADIDSIPESGRGLAIMQGYMDDVRYWVEGQDKHLVLTKNYPDNKE